MIRQPQIGQRVKALVDGMIRYGIIAGVRNTGAVDIMTDDGDFLERLPAQNVEPVDPPGTVTA